jgi:subtilisin family serine protease
MIHKRARTSLFAAVVAAGVVVVAPAGGAASGAVAATPAGPTVTLLTGDKVVLGGMRGVNVLAAKGREHISFYTREDVQGDVHVIPEDAVALLSKGKLDPRLFDVTELARNGYDDASRERLPLIVDHAGSGTPRTAGVLVGQELPVMSAAAVSVERTGTFWATAKNAEHVWLDGPVTASLDRSVPRIGAPEAWAAGHTGAGTTVAVLDTGIDTTHPDLSDAVTGARNFTSSATDDDRVGHGTHVASTITGNGDKHRGVAPDAALLNGKVLDDRGFGQESWIIAGMEWAAASGADVVNMSLGTLAPSDGTDPMSRALDRITEETGALFVVSSGNTGGNVGSPAAAETALTVGAVDRDDRLAGFSSRGRTDGGAVKPEITAPGVEIVAAKAKNGQIGDPAVDGYVSMSGTSMAAPHVAGAAAILAGQHPDWSPGQLKAALTGSAAPNDTSTVFEQGAGRVDVAGADTATVVASSGALNYGTALWPHDDDQPVAKTLAYTNSGSEPVTLDLTADVTGPGGAEAPRGMFTVEPARLTVPAGGQASATVTADTTVEAADGEYGGVVTAIGGGQSVRTLVAVNREVESYDVTLTFIDRNGAPTDLSFASFVSVDTPKGYYPYDESGTVVTRLPKGEYYFEGTVQTPAGDDYVNADFAEPAITVTGDTSLVLDAREAKPVSFTVDEPNARAGRAIIGFARDTAWGRTGYTMWLAGLDQQLIGPSATSKKDKFTFTVEARLGEWNGTSFDRSPYLYNVRHTENGAVPRTLAWTYHDRQLAKVRSTYAASAPGMIGLRERFVTMPLPGALTEYYTPDTPWDADFWELPNMEGNPVSWVSVVVPRTFELGRTTKERWNVGVYGPSFPRSDDHYFAARLGDGINVELPMATDQYPGRLGHAVAGGSTTLLRDGTVVGESPYPSGGFFEVGPESAEYTLRSTANRAEWTGARLSTVISAEWTFRSAHVDGSVPADIPLLAVRFAPNLDDHNEAPAGKRFTFPVVVERNGGAVGRVDTPAVEVSYDDGATWQRATVKRDHGRWKATVQHPATAEFVSLRANVADPDGNSQQVTIIRAYALK